MPLLPAESEDPTSFNPSSVDDNMEDSDTEKDTESKPPAKASSSMPGLDEYEFKDEEEEEDLSKALSDRHIYRKDLRQRDKDDKDKNHVVGRQSGKGDSISKPKKQKLSHCSSDTSNDEMENLSDKRNSPTCSQSSESVKMDTRSKKEIVEQKEKGKVKRKSKSQSKNKENQEDGKENSKALVLSIAAVSETMEMGREISREEDSFKMSFSPKDDSSVHLFHLSSIKSPKLNHSLTDKQTPLKQENAKLCISISDASAPVDAVKYNHYTEAEYCTEGSSTKACKHKEKSKHQQKDPSVDREDENFTPYKDGSTTSSLDNTDGALRKTDLDGKVVKKHKLKHKEKDKHRRDYEAERSHHRQKEARKDSHRNLEFDREFWKENFFKSDETSETFPVKKEGEDNCSLQKNSDFSLKEDRYAKEKHTSSKDKRTREDREKDKALKKERKEEKIREPRPSEREERADSQTLGRIPDEVPVQSNSMREESEEKPMSGITVDQEQLEPSEKGSREKTDKRLPVKERDLEKMEKRHLDKEKRVKTEHADKPEPQNSLDRWKEKEKMAAISSHLVGDKNCKENEKLKSSSVAKKHEDGRRNKDRFEKRYEKEKQDRDTFGDHREKERTNSDKKSKPLEKSDRSKEKDSERKKKDKGKDGPSSNLKVLLEEKKSYGSESGKSSSKAKDEGLRTPEKDRERRDRDSDKHKDKERHKERPQQAKSSKARGGETDIDKSKSKASPATRDKPKEKRLVNDDLMQTSFERMLSLKDREIEQWHRKHMEKIKQKERERLKQRPLADPGKSKPKDRTKSELGLSKELLRSKSSEASDVHHRDKPPRDTTGLRTMSLDGKSLPSASTKVTSTVENCPTRSPRPESERCGLMSRSVSLVSVASSDDSCPAMTLTSRPTELDTDMSLEPSDSQSALLQSSLLLLATRSPSAHDKESSSLPDVPQTPRTLLSSRHESPCLRAILDEDASLSAEGLPAPGSVAEEQKVGETSADTDESVANQQIRGSAPDAEPEGDPPAGMTQHMLGQDWESKTVPECTACLPESPEQVAPPSSDPAVLVQCLTDDLRAESSPKTSSNQHSTPADAPCHTNTINFQQKDPLPVLRMESTETGATHALEQGCKPPENSDAAETQQSAGASSEAFRAEDLPNPAPSTSTNSHGPTAREPQASEAMSGHDSPSPDVLPLLEGARLRLDAQLEKRDNIRHTSLCRESPECKFEALVDGSQTPETGTAAVSAPTESSSAEGGLPTEDSSESKAEHNSEAMEVTNSDENTECSSSSEDHCQSSGHTNSSSSTSGSSSPQSGDRDSDCSGAKVRLRPGDEDTDVHVPHPRKRKMLKVSAFQSGAAAQQDKDRDQQSLAAMVDSVKLEEIEPYQTERANPYYEFLHIRKKIEEKRKVLCNVTPQPPQYYDEYVTFNGSYLLDGNPLSKLCIPTVSLPCRGKSQCYNVGSECLKAPADGPSSSPLLASFQQITPPPSLPEQLKEMFKQQEVVRMKLRLQHSIERVRTLTQPPGPLGQLSACRGRTNQTGGSFPTGLTLFYFSIRKS